MLVYVGGSSFRDGTGQARLRSKPKPDVQGAIKDKRSKREPIELSRNIFARISTAIYQIELLCVSDLSGAMAQCHLIELVTFSCYPDI